MFKTRTIAGPLGGAALVALVVGAFALSLAGAKSAEPAIALPAPALGEATDSAAAEEKVVLAGGCFWGVQAVFQHVKGVTEAMSGYAGGDKDAASYEQVSTGRTGNAESVEVTFDPRVVSYGTILQIYFSVAHNPTELNYQGPDSGAQYRSEIFAESEAQKRVAEAYIARFSPACSCSTIRRPISQYVAVINVFTTRAPGEKSKGSDSATWTIPATEEEEQNSPHCGRVIQCHLSLTVISYHGVIAIWSDADKLVVYPESTTENGVPVRTVTTPLICQPPRIAPPIPLVAHFSPFPNGSL